MISRAPVSPKRAKWKKNSPLETLDSESRSKRARPNTRQILATYQKLVEAHPDAHCELDHRSAFELIVATALSAQSTDVQVNKVTPQLFRQFPTPQKLAKASQEEVESCINRLGMFRQKSKNLIGMAQALVRDHGGNVPENQEALVSLPGVGRKTANVVLGVAFKNPVGVVVDTHVQRITQRLGWTTNMTPEKIELDLMRLLPQKEWDRISHTLIFHGRRICAARKPACSTCPVNRSCSSAFHAEEVGRKPKKIRTATGTANQLAAKTAASSGKLADKKLADKKLADKESPAKNTDTKSSSSKKITARKKPAASASTKSSSAKSSSAKKRTTA